MMIDEQASGFSAKPALTRARRVYDKVGFVAEGVLRDALRWGDEWIDATVMSILAPEWSRHRGHPA
jgi:hypothetical protein